MALFKQAKSPGNKKRRRKRRTDRQTDRHRQTGKAVYTTVAYRRAGGVNSVTDGWTNRPTE